MHLRPALFATVLAVATACWFVVPAQQQTASADHVPVDSSEVPLLAGQISQRSEHLKPMFGEVHTADWVAKGAPEAYTSQWNSLTEQNRLIQNDMADIAQHPEGMEDVMQALFRVHRFDGDLNSLLGAIRRYQNPALADLIESVATGDQSSVEKLQQYVLDLANDKEKLLSVEDEEAQRCRSILANQPPVHTSTAKSIKATGSNKATGTAK